MTPKLEYNSTSNVHGFGSAVDDFAHNVNTALVEKKGMPDDKLDVSDLVRDLVVSINQQARTKSHPLLYVNLAFVLTIVFACGVLYQRVNELDVRVSRIQSTEALVAKVDSMQDEVKRLRDRLDRLLDQPADRPR